MAVHKDNLESKINSSPKYKDKESQEYLKEILERYNLWIKKNKELKGPLSIASDDDGEKIIQRVKFLNEYKDFIDQQHYAEKFDSRSNLHSTVIEEFLEHLFNDIVKEIDPNALIGKSHAFKDIFFRGTNFKDFLTKPKIEVEKKDHDFVIGLNLEARFSSKSSSKDFYESFDLPVVAIECKTYLDKTMLEGSSQAGTQIKLKNPDAIYIICAEWLKLTESVNLAKYDVDQIYVLRKQKNTDREFRYEDSYSKNPIYPDVVEDLFNLVRDHLTKDWSKSIESGLKKGKLI